MSFDIVNHGGRDFALLLILPNVRDAGSLRLQYRVETALSRGGSGRETREPQQPDLRLRQTCAYLLPSEAEAGELIAGLAALGNTPVAVPLWCDKLTGAQWADRIHTPGYLVRLSDGEILAGDAELDDETEYAPLLVGRMVDEPDVSPWTKVGGCVAEISIEEDGPWEYRIQPAATVDAGTWPATLVPDYTEAMKTLTEQGREYVQIGKVREKGVEHQEQAFRWGQSAAFLLKSRTEIRTLIATFATARGRWGKLTMPWWFTPAADSPATPHETAVRFAADTLELGFEGGAVARTTLRFWQLPAEVAAIEGETPAQAPRAYLYRHTLRTPTSPVVWRFTDWAEPITVDEGGDDVTYFPALIAHDRFAQGFMLDDDPVTLSGFVSDNHPWMLVLKRMVEAPLEIDIYEVNPESPGTVALRYSGEIADTPRGRGRKLSAPTAVLGGLLDIKVPAFYVQESCNHEFGSVGCGLDADDYIFTGTVLDITGADVTVQVTVNPTAWTLVDDIFAGGDAEIGAGLTYEGRDIIRSEDLGSGQQKLTLQRAFRGLETGHTLTWRPTCTGTWSECRDRYGNQAKYGGHRHMGPDNISLPVRETTVQGGKK